jgi:hypothetical protein
MGGLAFISTDASTYGSYTTTGGNLTLTTFGENTEYEFCMQGDQSLNLSLITVAKTGTLADPIRFFTQ